MISVLIISNESILRVGLRLLLTSEPGFKVIAETDETHAEERAAKLMPDVFLYHLSDPHSTFAELITRVRSATPEAGVVVLCGDIDHACLGRALAAGATSFVLLRGSPKYLFSGIRAARRRRRFLDPDLSEQVFDALAAGQCPGANKPLSRRELQVLGMFVEGYSLKAIASHLGLSPKSIQTYQSRLREKLNLHRRADLVRYALKTGILKGSSQSEDVE